MSAEDLDDELRNIGKTAPPAPAVNKFTGKPTEPKGKPKKGRGVGRPRKNKEPLERPPAPAPVNMDPDEVDIAMAEDPMIMEDIGAVDGSTLDDRIAACLKIEQLSKRLGASGSGVKPNPYAHTMEMLEGEIALMNAQIGGLHAERLIKMVSTQFIAPLIVSVYTAVATSISDEPPIDLSLFPEEVKENWDVVFGDAAAQIAINNPISFGKKAPYMAFIEGAVVCAASAAEKKMKRDAAAAAANASNAKLG